MSSESSRYDPEARGRLTDLRFNRLSIDEYEAFIQSGRLVRQPETVDDFKFEEANPNHPLAQTSRFRRIAAADYFHDLAMKTPEAFDLDLLQEMHVACFDCCAAVRLDIVRILGYLGNRTSLPVLEELAKREEGTWTAEAVTQAILVIMKDWPSIFEQEHNWFYDWMVSGNVLNSYPESWPTIKKYMEDKHRRDTALASVLLAGHRVLLENDSSLRLIGVDQASETSVRLTDGEATQMLNASKRDFAQELEMVGLRFEPTTLRVHLQNQTFLDEFPNSVLLDATTLKNAENCIKGMVTAVTLLDLSVFCTAAICYDRIVIQPCNSEMVRACPSLFSYIDYEDRAIPETLWTICARLLNAYDPNSPDTIVLRNAWREMFARSDIELNLPACGRYQNSPFYWDGIPAGKYFDQLFFHGRQFEQTSVQEINEFLSIQTLRTLFNDVLAGSLSLPYISTSIRGPVLGVLMKKKIQLKPIVDSLFESLGIMEASKDEKSPFTSEVFAPFFLGLVFERSKSANDVLSKILEYRLRAKPLRQQLAADRDAWSGRGSAYLSKVVREMSGFTSSQTELAKSAVDTTITAVTPLVTASAPQVHMASLGLKLASLLKPFDKLKNLYNRAFRPHIYWLTELSKEAKALRTIEAQLARIFGSSWTKEERNNLELLAGTYPSSFAKVRRPRD